MTHTFPFRTQSLSRRRRNSRARRASLERLEQRQLLSYADFELSSLLPANGGDGSKGFVVNGIVAENHLGRQLLYQPVGDVNQDGIDDLLLAAPGWSTAPLTVGQVYLIFGRQGGFPAELDLHSLDGSAGYVIAGSGLDDLVGGRSGAGGDVNHDGIPDLAIGAVRADPSTDRLDAGQTYVIYGGSAHLAALDLADGTQDGRIGVSELNGTHGFTIDGVAAGDLAGNVSIAGDVNADGIADLLIGANGSVSTTAGKVYVVFGSAAFPATLELSTLNGSNGFLIPGLGATDSIGQAVAGAGDVNHDGFADIVLGAPLADPSGRVNAGQAYVIFGRPSFPATFNLASLNGSNGFIVNGSVAGDSLGGFSVDHAGDVNGDGIDDVLIGAYGVPGPGGDDTGEAAYIIFGKMTPFSAVLETSTLNGSNGFAMRGVSAGDAAGYSASRAGDVNGDGYDDVIIGAPNADPNNLNYAGQSYVVYGRASFGASLDLASLLAANGGDGSAGYVLNGATPNAGSSARTVAGIGDINGDGFADVRIGVPGDPNSPSSAGQAFIVYGKPSPAPVTKFYVVNDASGDRTYEYSATGTTVENYAINSGNAAPRGAASTAAGDKVWVVDSNKNVYVYNTSGGFLGSWTAGSLASNATVEGIATNGTDVWIVDAKQDKVFRYTGAASRLSGSQNAASNFSLNNSNTSPKDIVTDGSSLWAVNDSSTDMVFKYNLSGTLLGSWTISSAGSSPTGITLDPSNVSNLWMVDSGTRRVYQFDNAAGRTSGSQSPSTSFALAAGNTNPQGIADPPVTAAGASQVAPLNKTFRPSGHLAANFGRTIPGVQASKSAGSFLRQSAGRSSVVGRQETPILISLVPSTDQDITLLAADMLRTGTKGSRSMLARTKV